MSELIHLNCVKSEDPILIPAILRFFDVVSMSHENNEHFVWKSLNGVVNTKYSLYTNWLKSRQIQCTVCYDYICILRTHGVFQKYVLTKMFENVWTFYKTTDTYRTPKRLITYSMYVFLLKNCSNLILYTLIFVK